MEADQIFKEGGAKPDDVKRAGQRLDDVSTSGKTSPSGTRQSS
jgi:hypothetical protein